MARVPAHGDAWRVARGFRHGDPRERVLRSRHLRRRTPSPCMARRLGGQIFAVHLRQCNAPKGGQLVQGVLGTFRLSQPVHRERPACRQYSRLCRRKPTCARIRRTVHALRIACRKRHNRRSAQLRYFHHQSGCTFLRWQTRHAGRRYILLGVAARSKADRISALTTSKRPKRKRRTNAPYVSIFLAQTIANFR